MASGRDVYFTADDRLHATHRGFVIKICGGEKISVVRNRDSGHSPARGFGGQFAHFASSVEQRIIRVQMKVDKVRAIHASLF